MNLENRIDKALSLLSFEVTEKISAYKKENERLMGENSRLSKIIQQYGAEIQEIKEKNRDISRELGDLIDFIEKNFKTK